MKSFHFPWIKFIVIIFTIAVIPACKKSEDPVPASVAGFTYISRGSFPVIATFTDMSSTTSGVIVQWVWSFGDGATAVIQNPVHGYYSPGTYNVALVTTTSTGVRDTVLMNLVIPVALTGPAGYSGRDAAFTYHLSWSFPYTVTFTNTSVNAASYLWDFGDGLTSPIAGSPFDHSYPFPGTYQVLLKTTNSAGSDTARATITLN